MTIKEVHIEAMKLTQQGIVARESGDEALAVSLFQRAFELEKEAALSFISNFEKEPTRSILFRSAATLALDCNKPDEAEKMVTHGLSGYPPEDIAEELRSLYENLKRRKRKKMDSYRERRI